MNGRNKNTSFTTALICTLSFLLLCSQINGGSSCDFDGNGFCDIDDIDALATFASNEQFDPIYDMTNDGVLDHADRDAWLLAAGLANGFSDSYFVGDADLDGDVDAGDLMTIGISWQDSDVTRWSQGNYYFGGGVNALDLNELGLNWQKYLDPAEPVPEPIGIGMLLFAFAVFALPRIRRVVLDPINKV